MRKVHSSMRVARAAAAAGSLALATLALLACLPASVPPAAPPAKPQAAPQPTASAAAAPTRAPSALVLAPAREAAAVIVRYSDPARSGRSSGIRVVPVPEGMTAAEYARELSGRPGVASAEPDYLLRPAAYVAYTSAPNDPDFVKADAAVVGTGPAQVVIPYGRSWALHSDNSAHFSQVWSTLASSEGTAGSVHVAVIDTGFYTTHPDARFSNIFAAIDECERYSPTTGTLTTDTVVTPVSMNAYGNDRETASHGTAVASIIGAAANNAEGSLGAAYDTYVDVYKVQGTASEAGSGLKAGEAVIPESAIVNAIYDALDAADAGGYRLVINLSLEIIDADPSTLTTLKKAVADARARGAVVVAASGNAGTGTVSYPAACTGAIAVGASEVGTAGIVHAPYSNYGTALDFVAPGTAIWAATIPGIVVNLGVDDPGYTYWKGTSMASPYVASAAALLLRVEPSLTVTEVVDYLKAGARDLSTPGWDSKTGWGTIDAYESYLALTMPHTTADIRPYYALEARIEFSVEDRVSEEGLTTYYRIDGSRPLAGSPAVFSSLGPHTIEYWSVDAHGVVEEPHAATFEIRFPDPQPPETSSDATASYVGRATVNLTASDAREGDWGVETSHFQFDGGAVHTGTVAVIGSTGAHRLRFWSVDWAGNVEDAHEVTLTVVPATASVTISRSVSSTYRNRQVRLSGYLTPGVVGDSVRIQMKTPGSSTWRYISTSSSVYRRAVTSVSSTGRGTWSSVYVKLTKRGRYYFRAVFAGDALTFSRKPATSSTVSVYVR